MSRSTERKKHDVQKAADIIRDAGGRIVGRTRLQKIGYLLELAGLGDGFTFEYRHYGPYSEELALAARNARLLSLIEEEEHPATWGGTYSIYSATPGASDNGNPLRAKLAHELVDADPIELELAATAAFLAAAGASDPWGETARRKPEKVQGDRLKNARALYQMLQQLNTPKRLPQIG